MKKAALSGGLACLEARTGFEPVMKALQASALPLGHLAVLSKEVGRKRPTPNKHGADNGVRTRDPHLGKVMLYQLSHVRVARRYITQLPKTMQGKILKFWNFFRIYSVVNLSAQVG